MKQSPAILIYNSNYSKASTLSFFFKIFILSFLLLNLFILTLQATDNPRKVTKLFKIGLSVIPYPQQVNLTESDFVFGPDITIVVDKNASASDRFSAQNLANKLKEEWNINTEIRTSPGQKSIRLTRKTAPANIGNQGYRLISSANQVTIEANGETGLFYGVQTLTQLIKKDKSSLYIPGMEIIDWPDIKERAIHYDTKHHQDKKGYVKRFIRELAHYKINMLVWEWEDKFLYPSHPKIGAPGAFTMEEMQEFTRYARKYHVQLVPLVQGLGHVSYILKWPKFAHLREIDASNWEFCPLKEGTYDLLFDLWEDAIKATPGSEYIHIGSDETYELGKGIECGCKQETEEIGKSGLYHIFLDKAAEHLSSLGRKVMAWERPMGWKLSDSPIKGGAEPAENLVLTESYSYKKPDFRYIKEAKRKGYMVFAYDPNPGIEPLFLPYYYRKKNGKIINGSLEHSYNFLTSAANSGVFDGMIRTSWDDAGLHNQFWMLHFLNAAEYSWNGSKPSFKEFKKSFFENYYGTAAANMGELFRLLNEASYYYWETFERKVWHFTSDPFFAHGNETIGKTYLPDLPRGNAIEFDPYWNQEYEQMVERSSLMYQKMKRALQICQENINAPVKHKYDFKLFKSIIKLVKHTSQVYLGLSALEDNLQKANDQRFLSHIKAYTALKKGVQIVAGIIERREEVFTSLVEVWGKTRLPKGFSTNQKKYFHRQDRAHHFANRRPDMTYLIYDERQLNMDEYLKKLRDYIVWYEATFIK